MTPDDLDAILAGATDPAAATLARALREAWAEQEHLRELVERASAQVHAVAAERDAAEQRANRLALDINVRDAILDRAGAKLGWPSGLSVASYWRDRMEAAVDETAGRISKLENLVAQARESYPRAEVLRMLDAAGVEGVGIVDRVRELVSERDEWKRAAEKREVDGAALSSRLRADKATERQRAERAEQERDAALAAVDAVRADYAPRREPPTADEVRAVAGLWEHRGGQYVPGAPFLAMRELGSNETVPIVLHLDAEHDEVSIVTESTRGVHSEPLTNALHVLASWCAVGPTGPVAWSELARLVEGVRRG